MATMTFVAQQAPPGSIRFASDTYVEVIAGFVERDDSVSMLVLTHRGVHMIEASVEAVAYCSDEFECAC